MDTSELLKKSRKNAYTKYYKENTEKAEKDLEDIGIKHIRMFEELNETEYHKLRKQEELTILFMPINGTIQNYNGIETKKKVLDRYNIILEKEDQPLDMNTGEIQDEGITFVHLISRRIIIPKINILAKQRNFQTFMNEIIDYYNDNYGIEDIKVYTEQEIQEKVLQNTIHDMVRRNQNEIDRQITQFERTLQDLERQYKENYGNLVLTKKEKQMYTQTETELMQKLKDEIEEIKKLPYIKSVEVTDTVRIKIENINITAPILERTPTNPTNVVQKKVYINDLEFCLLNQPLLVKGRRTVNGTVHPHVDQHGTPCFGESSLEVRKLQSTLELSRLASLLYAWSRSYNADSCFNQIINFHNENKKEGLIQ